MPKFWARSQGGMDARELLVYDSNGVHCFKRDTVRCFAFQPRNRVSRLKRRRLRVEVAKQIGQVVRVDLLNAAEGKTGLIATVPEGEFGRIYLGRCVEGRAGQYRHG